MIERLQTIETANEVLNQNNPAWKEEINWLIQRAKRADELESIYRKDWIELINEAKEMGLSPEQVRKYLREGKK